MNGNRGGWAIGSEDEALEMLEAYVAGERRLIQLHQEIERRAGEPSATAGGGLAPLIAEQQRRYEALLAWWEADRPAPPVARHGSPRPQRRRRSGSVGMWARLQELFPARRRACPE